MVRKSLALVSVVTFYSCVIPVIDAVRSKKSISVLWLGNSFIYVNNLDQQFSKLAHSLGTTVTSDRIAHGWNGSIAKTPGLLLFMTFRGLTLFMLIRVDPLLLNVGGDTLCGLATKSKAKIIAGKYDFVVLQGQSQELSFNTFPNLQNPKNSACTASNAACALKVKNW